MLLLVSVFLSMALTLHVEGHGRLVEPPSRASAWRYGFNTPAYYDDNQLYCGGFYVQWYQNSGKCGICGDAWQGPRDHEAGGKYATGTITRTYKAGSVIPVTVQLTANHKGWFEFHLCPHNNPSTPARQACFDEYLLELVDGRSRYEVHPDMSLVKLQLKLPPQVTCTQCILQWKYNTGHSWGTDSGTGRGCIGCGPQEQFFGCADVTIRRGEGHTAPYHLTPQNPETEPRTAIRQHIHQPIIPSQRSPVRYPPTHQCRPIGPWVRVSGMRNWCHNNCAKQYCPPNMCMCMK